MNTMPLPETTPLSETAPPPAKGIARVLLGVRALGLGLAIRGALYPFRRAYYEAKFGAGDNGGSVLRGLAGLFAARQAPEEDRLSPHDFVLLGDVLSLSHEGQTVTICCQNASLQVTILAADLLRVRLSPVKAGRYGPSGIFPPLQSYAVAKADDEWTQTPYTLKETAGAIEIRTARVTCHIAKRPCRLAFLDGNGRRIHADTSGLGWRCPEPAKGRGRRVVRFSTLEPHEHVYGLGEKAFPLDRRGRSYVMWNNDPQNYAPGDDPIYLNIPFYIGLHEDQSSASVPPSPARGYGLFYDNSYRSRFDIGETTAEEAIYLADDGELRYYFFYGPALTTILERYTELTGHMSLPPLWALGYQQSRWSYYPESRVREIARLFREHRIPCDVLHLDIDYMDGYRCFTWDKKRFPNPSALLTDLHNQGFKVVVIIDCGIKTGRHYHVFAEGLEKGMFCTYPDGTIAVGPVWPGDCCFPDFTNPRVRQWWGQLYAPLTGIGVDGIWNDMNEPTVISTRGDTLARCVRHNWEGTGTDHRQAHNVYGMQMARATTQGLQHLRPNRRAFVITRAGWAGVQRYAVSWTGDNQSTWEHLRLTMPMLMGLGLSGLAFSGPDIGGFDGGAEAELLVRWTQLGVFLPFFRNHASRWSREQEPWVHGEPYLTMNRNAIELRYRLLPYLYTATWQCTQSGQPIVRPLLLAYQDDVLTYSLDDEFLCGDALLVAPVCEAGVTIREVYLPAGQWFDFWTEELHTGPTSLKVAAPLERTPLFVRAGTVLPTWPVLQHTGAQAVETLILHVYAGDGDSWLYEDDGHSLAYQRGEHRVTSFECRTTGENSLTIACQVQGAYRPTYADWEWNVHGQTHVPERVLADGQPVQDVSFDEARRILRFTGHEVQRIDLS